MSKASYPSEVTADLARSGLDEAAARTLKLKFLPAKAARSATGDVVTGDAYVIPYPDPTGKLTKFFRLKLLQPQGSLRYWQPPNTLPQLYFPATWTAGWPVTLSDVTVPLYITEGEKKAAKACAEGLPTVGLGGVWSWMSKKKTDGATLGIADLDLITWSDRTVNVVFDSDVTEKLDVQKALRAFAQELAARGARPYSVQLPSGPNGSKTGLDDFLLNESATAFENLEKTPALGRLPDELWRLNQELTYVEEAEAVWRFKTRRLVSRAQLVDVAYANRTVAEVTERGVKQLNVAKAWLQWPARRSVRRLAYVPGADENLDDGALNLWRGWGVEPKRGNVEPWHELLEYLFAYETEARAWFEMWCACPLQRPGIKLYTAAILLSLSHGVGKSLIGMTLGKIYGENFALLSEEELKSAFNPWAAGKQFVLGDEITGTERRRDADRVKNLVTRDLVTVNVKFQPQYVIPDCINYLFTTNHPDAFVLERMDRRFFVHETDAPPLDPQFYKDYDAWLREGGASALFYYLLHEVDCAAFNPKAPAPVTEAKSRMTELSLSDLDTFAADLLRDPDRLLRIDGKAIGSRDLFTLEELLAIADPGGARKTTKIALAKALRRAGVRSLDPTRTVNGIVKLWPVKHVDRWNAAGHDARKAEYERGRPPLAAVPETASRKF